MKRKILFEYIFIIFSCLLGGIFDCYSFLFRNKSFCLIQTGNVVKIVIELVNNNYLAVAYSSIIVVSYCIFVLIFYLITRWLKSKKINYFYFVMITISILLLPAMLIKYNNSNYLDYKNIISGIALTAIGSMLSISYKSVQFLYKKKMIFNVTMMTGNLRSLMICLGDYIRTKNKESLQLFFAYIIVITTFILGVLIVSLTNKFMVFNSLNLLLMGFIYLIIIMMIIFLHFRYQFIKSNLEEQKDK